MRTLTLLPGGQQFLLGSDDKSIKLWDLETGENVATFSTESPLWSCALAADGQMAFAGDELGNLHFLKVMDSRTRTA